MWTPASSMARSMRAGGWGVMVWGLIAFREMKLTTWRRFSSMRRWRCSEVRLISPSMMILRAMSMTFVVPKALIRSSSGTRSPRDAFSNTSSTARISSIFTLRAVLHVVGAVGVH